MTPYDVLRGRKLESWVGPAGNVLLVPTLQARVDTAQAVDGERVSVRVYEGDRQFNGIIGFFSSPAEAQAAARFLRENAGKPLSELAAIGIDIHHHAS